MSYTSRTGLPQKTAKYQCVVSGAKRLAPCAGCPNAKACLVKSMQYKESGKMAETPTVKLNADGSIGCAKGLDIAECGYKPGAKVCGKCGAAAVSVKGMGKGNYESDWVSDDDKKPKKMMQPMVDDEEDDEEEDGKMMNQDSDPLKKKKSKKMMGMKPGSVMEEMASEEESDDEEEKEMNGGTPMASPTTAPTDDEEDDDDESMIDDEEEKMWNELEDMVKKRKKARKKRMASMGMKSAEFAGDDNAFVCGIERKMYGGGSSPCANCPGGCEPHNDMPSLLEVEGIAEDMFSGKILDSGYADLSDIFVVDIQRKDGKPIEAYFDGSTGECMGWHLLNEDLIGEVGVVPGDKVISFDDAADIAVKSIEGEVIAVDADMFEGYDAYAVEIEGVDGKSYDVFVGVDGEILGYDEYDPEQANEIEEEVADLALKRMYSDERRKELAAQGHALPDGSYPIVDEADLKNAIQAYGRAKDKSAAKTHITKRAKALGRAELIPDEWSDGEKVLSDDEAKKFIGDLLEFEMLTVEQDINPKN